MNPRRLLMIEKLYGATSKNQNGKLKESKYFEYSKITLKIASQFKGLAMTKRSTVSLLTTQIPAARVASLRSGGNMMPWILRFFVPLKCIRKKFPSMSSTAG